jgi:hypothetical protein
MITGASAMKIRVTAPSATRISPASALASW